MSKVINLLEYKCKKIAAKNNALVVDKSSGKIHGLKLSEKEKVYAWKDFLNVLKELRGSNNA